MCRVPQVNVWGWVYSASADLRGNGHDDLATQMLALAGYANGGRSEEASAAGASLLAGARALRLPWMEVFTRHWLLQSRVAIGGEGLSALTDAVDALDRAHREETSDCPQAVCTTQDMAMCYANVDGPGYAAERIEVVSEALERIDPTWSCFNCLTAELVEAIVDSGKPEEALAAYRDARRRQLELSITPSGEFLLQEADLLIATGSSNDAVELLTGRAMRRHLTSEQLSVYRLILLAKAYARLERWNDSAEALTEHKRVIPFGRYHADWVRVEAALIGAGVHANDATTAEQLRMILSRQVAAQATRPSAEIAVVVGRLAAERGARNTARWALATAQTQAPQLRDPTDLAPIIAKLEDEVAAMVMQPLPVPPEKACDYLQKTTDDPLERCLDIAEVALEALPESSELSVKFAELLIRQERAREALGILRAAVEKTPTDRALVGLLQAALLQERDRAGAADLEEKVLAADPPMGVALRARRQWVDREWADCITTCREAVALDTTFINTRRIWANAARQLEDWSTAVSVLEEVVAHPECTDQDRWALIVAASAAQDWPALRTCAVSLGFPMDLEGGEPNDSAGRCVISTREGGREQRYAALRIGPASARIFVVSYPGTTQRAGDIVVFEPSPLEPVPTDPDALREFIPVFAQVCTLRQGDVAPYLIAGPVIGRDEWSSLCATVRARGWYIWNYRSDDHTMTASGIEEAAVWAVIGVPKPVPPRDVDAALESVVGAWRVRPAWPDLADLAGANVKKHKKLWRSYGFEET